MLSNNQEDGIVSLEFKENDEDTVSECFTLVQSMHQYIEDTRKSALEMDINKASFLMMVFHLMDLKPVLDQLVKEPNFLKMHSIWPTLRCLAETLRDLYNFTHVCSSRSRIFLIYSSNVIVDEINRQLKQLSICLGAVHASGLDLPLELQSSIEGVQAKFTSSIICQESGYSDLSKEISACLDDPSCDEVRITTLLRKIADHLKIPEFEAAELKQELQNDLGRAEAEGHESKVALQALNALFSSAQVLNERRRLASVDSPLLPTSISSIPSSFFCPITKSIMREPVMIAEEGFTYEKSAILEWFNRGHKTCPDTGRVLQSLALVPNLKLQQAMDEFFDHMYHAQMVYVLQALRNQGVEMPVEQAVHSVKRLTDLGSKYRQLLFTLDGVEPLVGLLKPSAPHIREVIIKILIDVSTAGDAQKVAIIEAGAVRVLLGLLQKNPAENSSLSQLLCELSKTQSGKIAIVSEKGYMLVIASAFHASPEIRRPQIRILLDNLCKDDMQVVVEAAKSTIFEPLVASLSSGDDHTRLTIVTAVWSSLDLSEINSAALVNAGIVPPLLSLVQDCGSTESMLIAIKFLYQLSCTEQNKMPIANAGAIPVLVKFLGYPSDEVIRDVTLILSNLATDSENAHAIDSEGAVIRLFSMMKSRDTMLQEYSLRTLGFMAKDSRTVRSQVVELGMISIFYALLESRKLPVTCQRSILSILCHVTKDTENLGAVAPSAEGIKYLIGQLGCGDVEEKEVVLAILEALSHADGMANIMLSEERLLMMSTQYLQQPNPKIQESAAGLLAKFAEYGTMERNVKLAFVRHNIFAAFLALINDEASTKAAKENAAKAVCLLSSCTSDLMVPQSSAQKCLARIGFKQCKACIVHGGKCSVRDTFCLVEAGAIPSLINLINESEVETSMWAVKALYTLVDDTQHSRRGIDLLMKSDILVPVVKLVGKDPSSTEASVKLLENIFRVRKYRDVKNSNVAKTVLMATMAAGNADVRKVAATSLMHLGIIPTDTSYMTATST
eukprot:c22512_g1_i2 orf=467-3505(-)